MDDVSQDPIILDLSRFSTKEEALSIAKGDCPNSYIQVSRKYVFPGATMSSAHLLFMSAVSRAIGLHEGALREINADNPHSVFILNRGFLELLSILMFTADNPEYIDVLTGLGPGKDGPRKRFKDIFQSLEKEAPGFMNAYDELSKYAHFQDLAVYNAHSPMRVGDDLFIRWSPKSGWANGNDLKIACAQLKEFHTHTINALETFGSKFLNGQNDKPIIGPTFLWENSKLDQDEFESS